MLSIIAVLVCLTVRATSAEDCPNPVTCPCGSQGGENVTLCVPANDLAAACARLSKCEACENGSNICSKCPAGLEGPLCSRAYCTNPGRLLNGRMRYLKPGFNLPGGKLDYELDKYESGTVLKYFCDEGFLLQGPDTLTCQPTGLWSSKRPACVKEGHDDVLPCENPGSVQNGRVQYFAPDDVRKKNQTRASTGATVDKEMDEYPAGSVLKYTCDKSFQLRGSGSLTCESTGFWSAERPTCVGAAVQ